MPKSKSAHTPGPWTWTIHDESAASLQGPGEMEDHVITVGPCKSCQPNVKRTKKFFGSCTVPNEANAALIAAAPDLLEACREALKEISGYYGDTSNWEERKTQRMLLAAISKCEVK